MESGGWAYGNGRWLRRGRFVEQRGSTSDSGSDCPSQQCYGSSRSPFELGPAWEQSSRKCSIPNFQSSCEACRFAEDS